MIEWLSFSDAPRDGTLFLAYSEKYEDFEILRFIDGAWLCDNDTSEDTSDFSHFTYLDKPT